MKRVIFTVMSSLVLSLLVQTANAAPILTGDIFWASGSIFQTNFDQSPERADPANAFGPPNNLFYSPGLGGAVTFNFGGMVFENGGIATIYETTFGNVANYPEVASLSIGLVGSNPITSVVFTEVSPFNGVSNLDAQGGFSFEMPDFSSSFDTFLMIDDTLSFCGQSSSCNGDGFDINALSFQPYGAPKPVPTPGSLALMSLGLVGLGMAVNRRKIN